MNDKTGDVGAHFLETAIADFRQYKRMAERAFEQLDTPDFHNRLGENTNSIAVIAKHISGNLRSRWSDFLFSDGEKPTRKRDTEFVEDRKTKDEILEYWEGGWEVLFGTLLSLTGDDLTRETTIRGVPHTVMKAVMRASEHVAYHVGQIQMLARHVKGGGWSWLTIPPGESEKYYRTPPGK